MGKLISVVGNTGVGKTTFVLHLCQAAKFTVWLEQNDERPFQERFSQEKQKYALTNQIDFLVFRAEQEIRIRKGVITGVQDGGLGQDFYIFTRLFYRKSYLTEDEYTLCDRTYRVIRQMLPPPDLIIWMRAPLEVIAERFNQRNRSLSIAQIEDMEIIEDLLKDWLEMKIKSPLLKIETEAEDRNYTEAISKVIDHIQTLQ